MRHFPIICLSPRRSPLKSRPPIQFLISHISSLMESSLKSSFNYNIQKYLVLSCTIMPTMTWTTVGVVRMMRGVQPCSYHSVSNFICRLHFLLVRRPHLPSTTCLCLCGGMQFSQQILL